MRPRLVGTCSHVCTQHSLYLLWPYARKTRDIAPLDNTEVVPGLIWRVSVRYTQVNLMAFIETSGVVSRHYGDIAHV